MSDIVDQLRRGVRRLDVKASENNAAERTLAKQAADEIEKLRYVLDGVRGAILTGRNEPLVIWKEQIDIAIGPSQPRNSKQRGQ